MHDENTGDEPKCVLCGSPDDCEHLVACIDRTNGACEGSAIYDRDHEFQSEIETAFIVALKAGKDQKWQHNELEELWNYARTDFDVENEYVAWDQYAFVRLLVELLEDVGAIRSLGAWVTDGGPGFSYSYSLLYADKPDVVIDEAKKSLKAMLNDRPRG